MDSLDNCGLPPIATVEQVAAYLHIGRTAAYEAVRTGLLPSVRIGKLYRISRAALFEWLGQSDAESSGRVVETIPGSDPFLGQVKGQSPIQFVGGRGFSTNRGETENHVIKPQSSTK